MQDSNHPEAIPAAEAETTTPKRRGSRRKAAEAESADHGLTDQGGDVFAQLTHAGSAADQALQNAQHSDGDGLTDEGEIAEPPKREWKSRFGYWRNEEAGVRIERDRRNNLNTIFFRERPPADAVGLLTENGWREDPEGGYSKKLDALRRSESQEQADNMAVAVTNVVLKSKGLPEIDHFYISRQAER